MECRRGSWKFCYECDSIYRERISPKQRARLSRQRAADERMMTRCGEGHSDTRPDIKYAVMTRMGGRRGYPIVSSTRTRRKKVKEESE